MNDTKATVSGPRLLYVATVASTVHHFLRPYARQLRADGWQVDAAANGLHELPGLSEAFDRLEELPLSRSLFDLRGILAATRAIARLLRSGRYDIVHVHTPIAAFAVRAAATSVPRNLRPSIVYTAHGFHFHE